MYKSYTDMLRHVVDAIPSPLFIKNAEGRFLLINKALQEAYHLPEAAVLGKTLPEVEGHATAKERQMWHDYDMRHMEQGGSRTDDWRCVYPGNEERLGQLTLSCIPLGDAERPEQGLVGVFSDQSELRDLTRSLRKLNKWANVALELSRAGYWHLPPQGGGDFIVSERGRDIFGDSPTPGNPFYWSLRDWEQAISAADPDQLPRISGRYQRAVLGEGNAYDEVYLFRRPADGVDIWVHDRGMFVRKGERPELVQGVIQDITLFKQAEIEAQRARRAAEQAARGKSVFLANMSHELRTPMNGILGMSHLLMQDNLSETQRGYLRAIEVSGQLLLKILGDVLEYAKFESGSFEPEQIDFSPREMLVHHVRGLAAQAEAKGLAFDLEVDDDIPAWLHGDPGSLAQVLGRLMENAVKFTAHGGVTVRAMRDRSAESPGQVAVLFTVEDSGIGMGPEDLPHIFTPFYQGDGSNTRQYGGSGLGLAICKRLVDLCGGTLTITSQPGQGSVCRFTAILAESGHARGTWPPAPVSLEEAAQVLRGARVLVVEDNEINQLVAENMLSRMGVFVSIAEHGVRAVCMARKTRYDAVLMDIQMPEMDGLEATRLLRTEFDLDVLPVIAVTAHVMPEDRRKSLASGMNAHLDKPLDPEQLFTTLAAWIKHARTVRAAAPGPVAGAAPSTRSPGMEHDDPY